MREATGRPTIAAAAPVIGAAFLALLMAQLPAHAGGDVSNFKVKNCTTERMFVCSFDKTDSSMKIPYKAAGVQPNDKKEFGCASLGRCKVIIGVSKKKSKNTLSSGMQAALATGAGSAAAIAGMTGVAAAQTTGVVVGQSYYWAGDAAVTATASSAAVTTMAVVAGVAAVAAVAAGGSVAALEIADGWSDGEVCNQVRRAAEKAGMKPRDFMQDGKTYKIVPQYAVDQKGNPYLNADGTAVFAYKIKQGNSCPTALKAQLVPN